MKVSISDFIQSRAKIKAAQDVQASFDNFKASIAKFAKNASKVYLNEFGNEVHVNGPIVAVLKTETLREKIERLDRLAATVRANRAAMMQVYNDMGVVGIDKDGNPVVEEEDPNDFSLLDDVETKDEFGESLLDDVETKDEFGEVVANSNKKPSADADAPAGEPAAPTAKPAVEQAAEASDDDAAVASEEQ